MCSTNKSQITLITPTQFFLIATSQLGKRPAKTNKHTFQKKWSEAVYRSRRVFVQQCHRRSRVYCPLTAFVLRSPLSRAIEACKNWNPLAQRVAQPIIISSSLTVWNTQCEHTTVLCFSSTEGLTNTTRYFKRRNIRCELERRKKGLESPLIHTQMH